MEPRGFLFDVYGTVVDWFTPLRDAAAALAHTHGQQLDADQFARDWRNGYARATSDLAASESPWQPLAVLTMGVLEALVRERFGGPITQQDLDAVNATWRRLPPWPDTVPGLSALRRFGPIGTCSNGSREDMLPLAEFAGLPWDHYLGSQASGFYKPHADTYLKSVAAMGLTPEATVMVACHQKDLVRTTEFGMQTAFVRRPAEFGGVGVGEEREVTGNWTFVADSLTDLARQVGAVVGRQA